MDQPSGIAGSVRRARERALAGLPREDVPIRQMSPMEGEGDDGNWSSQPAQPMGLSAGPSRIPRPQARTGMPRDGQAGMAISRPQQVPQWPLAAPYPSEMSSDYGESPGLPQAPQRPPRPSQVPSMLDASRIQDPVPSVFPVQEQNQRESNNEFLSVPSGPQTPSSRPSTLSSVGTIPDFPVPVNAPLGPSRRSVNLGPPPSARRGASSFYSNASYVSPIPEESPRSRSHGSYASSSAMPDGWTTDSPGYSPGDPETFFDERVRDSSRYSDSEFGDESQLVRSASVGKRGVPALVMTPSQQQRRIPLQRPSPSPIQPEPSFAGGTAYLEASSTSSGALPTSKKAEAGSALTVDGILGAYEGASGSDPAAAIKMSTSPKGFSRLSAIRRPPRLDIDAVRDAEARGSLTSLPDLIKRATRLAAMIERGRRPASRFDMNDFPDDIYNDRGWDPDKDPSINEKHQSGLSDMLAAFPPPAQAVTATRRSSFRQSLRQSASTAWPLPFSRSQNTSQETVPRENNSLNDNSGSNGSNNVTIARSIDGGDEPPGDTKRERDTRRRCCGLPLWGFIVVVIIVIILIAAAVVIPLQFFVFNQDNGDVKSALSECQTSLPCQNGGTNVISQGVCSCICTNGFTGSDCSTAGSEGCTTVTIDSTNSTNISNVTLGQAIPRLIESAQTNFSVPLSATAILAKLNTDSLSCTSQNALVTFDGESMRDGSDVDVTSGSITLGEEGDDDGSSIVVNELITLTIQPGGTSTVTLSLATGMGFSTIVTAPTASTVYATTLTLSTVINSRTPVITTTTPTSTETTATATPSSTFTVSDDAIDFARVAVLFILQEESLDSASDAQNNLQQFFSAAESTRTGGATAAQAMNITVGDDNTVDLVNFLVDVGSGPVGGSSSQ
ncbi:hypothetical protein MKZ38_004750 [Zalerion maritima]|uniref:EGF-like domain-containing protein n=1 Tax=Zalerion maritima TaxID=339359 RepID=A0AAD5WWD1_9PEZI|nr:hypothetical protein MKZ38_004750 [Zalerion maritima]